MDIKSGSIMLSILAKPASSGIIYSRGTGFNDLIGHMENQGVQEHLVKFYGADPLTAACAINEKCSDAGIKIVTIWDREYPVLLREIYMPPLVLYCRGTLEQGRHISIVGTRGSDSCSGAITRKVAGALAEKNITVVSGLAVGIDRNAHLGALSHGGATVAVLPQGVDVVSPAANRDIYLRITGAGNSAVLSEYPPGVRSADKWIFARRNRIISGMSSAVVIIQAPVKSGAMITARYALEQNRDIYACPGNAFDESYGGCHYLIKQGASMLTDIDEFLCSIDPAFVTDHKKEGEIIPFHEIPGDLPRTAAAEVNSNPVVQAIVRAAGSEWTDIDETARSSGIPIDEINMAVTEMEISGTAVRRGNRIKILSR